MNLEDLQRDYRKRYQEFLVPMAKSIEHHVREIVGAYPRIDRIVARAKAPERFMQKAQVLKHGRPRYQDPLAEIQDQIGVRVVTYYLNDTARIGRLLREYLSAIEAKDLVHGSASAFGYEGKHYVFLIPVDLLAPPFDNTFEPKVFELQVKTVFQHAWGEADHDLGYKPATRLTHKQKRLIAYAAAQAWGADKVFDELSKDLVQFN